jgi:hypothetical protein
MSSSGIMFVISSEKIGLLIQKSNRGAQTKPAQAHRPTAFHNKYQISFTLYIRSC